MRNHLRQDLTTAFTLAILLCLWLWIEVSAAHLGAYFTHQPASTHALATTLCAGIYLVLTTLMIRMGRADSRLVAIAGGFCFLALSAFALLKFAHQGWILLSLLPKERDQAIAQLSATPCPGHPVFVLALCMVAAALAYRRWHAHSIEVVSRRTRIFFPLAVVLVANGLAATIWRHLDSDRPRPAIPIPAGVRAKVPPRIVWLIFDEMDYTVAFSRRPSGLKLPAFDRLRAESVFASSALPAADWTRIAVPALLTGERLIEATNVGTAELQLDYAGGRRANLSDTKTIFHHAAAAGVAAGVVGWYHPYCRLFSGTLAWCAQFPALSVGPVSQVMLVGESIGLTKMFTLQLARSVGAGTGRLNQAGTPDSWAGSVQWEIQQQRYWELHENLRAASLEALRRSDLGLIWLHQSIPHPLALFPSGKGWPAPDPSTSYSDNLRAADDLLSRLRAEMENLGNWENSAVIVMSDHPLRPFWRVAGAAVSGARLIEQGGEFVPFMVKLPGRHYPVEYHEQFSALAAYDIVQGLLRGRVQEPAQVLELLDRRRITATPLRTPLPEDARCAHRIGAQLSAKR